MPNPPNPNARSVKIPSDERGGWSSDRPRKAGGPPRPPDVSVRFAQAQARIGINLRESPRTHYDDVTDAFRAVIDSPPGLHYGAVKLRARHFSAKESS